MFEVSIIIPAHNKATELLFCLKSLTQQDIPSRYFEVIVVDDGSTDATQEIITLFEPYLNLHCIRTNCGPSGLARIRNMGLKFASGQIIICLDADIVVNQNFVKSHWEAHQDVQQIINLGYIYAVGISDEIWSKCTNTTSLLRPFFKVIESSSTLRKFLQHILSKRRRRNHGWTIMNWPKSGISTWNFSDNNKLFLKASSERVFPDLREYWISEQDELMNSPVPWTYFWGGNVSIRTNLLEEVGLFDEGFAEYGSEDLELGYRLYKTGTNFVFDKEAKGFHYPHPRDTIQNKQSERISNKYFLEKHPTLEVEVNAAFGCFNVNEKLLEVQILTEFSSSQTQSLSKLPKIWNFFKENNLNPCLVVGCDDGSLLHKVGADTGLEAHIMRYELAKHSFPDKKIYRLLGIATPFEKKSFRSVIVTNISRYLKHKEFLYLVIQEGLRVGKHFFLVTTADEHWQLLNYCKGRNRWFNIFRYGTEVQKSRSKHQCTSSEYQLIEVFSTQSGQLQTKILVRCNQK